MDTRLDQLAKTNRNPVEETEYQNLLKSSNGSSANGAPDNANALLAEQKAQTAAFNQDQRGLSADFLNRFKGAVAGQETLPNMATRIGGELGLPQLQANSQSLNNTLFNLPSTYGAATRGFDVNANQLARIIGQKQSELAPAAALASQNTLNAQDQVTKMLGYGVQQQQKELLPYQTESSMLSEQQAREFSGFTADKQNQLTSILSDIANKRAVSAAQLAYANQLALAKLGYDSALAVAKVNSAAKTPTWG